jgi:hypothetical protein
MKVAKHGGNLLMLTGTGTGTQNSPEDDLKALAYLQSIYRNPMEATTTRMRAAIECLPFENPKLSATAIATLDGNSFAEALERCIARSGTKPLSLSKVIDATPVEIPAEEMKRPMAHYRNNFRRY